jgi:uncharacterized protein (DUF3820 family)
MSESALSSELVSFGKYKGKPVLNALADKNYISWLKQQPWFTEEKHGSFFQVVYNVSYTIAASTEDARTPEHNRMQNLFLRTDVTQSLLNRMLDYRNRDFVAKLVCDPEFVRFFGIHKVEDLVPDRYDPDPSNREVVFEGEHNWDLILSHCQESKSFRLTSLESAEKEVLASYEKLRRENLAKVEEFRKEEQGKIDKEIVSLSEQIERKKEELQRIRKYWKAGKRS